MGKLLKFFVAILTLLIILGMVIIMFFASRPTDLPEIDGKAAVESGNLSTVRDIKNELDFSLKSKTKLTLTEADINKYLGKYIKGKQDGKGKEYVEFKGIWVNLVEDTAQLFIEREITYMPAKDGQPAQKQSHVTQFDIKVVSTVDATKAINLSRSFENGKIGQISTPGQFIKLTKLPFDNLAAVLKEELDMIDKMKEIHISEGSIEFSPKVKTVEKVKPKSQKIK